jgi:hypothetical protein
MESKAQTFEISNVDPKTMNIEQILNEMTSIASEVFEQLRLFYVVGKKVKVSTGFLSEERFFEGDSVVDSWRQALVWARKRVQESRLARKIELVILSMRCPSSFERIFSDLETVGQLLEKEITVRFWEDATTATVRIIYNENQKQIGRSDEYLSGGAGRLLELLRQRVKQLEPFIHQEILKKIDFCQCGTFQITGHECSTCGKTHLNV